MRESKEKRGRRRQRERRSDKRRERDTYKERDREKEIHIRKEREREREGRRESRREKERHSISALLLSSLSASSLSHTSFFSLLLNKLNLYSHVWSPESAVSVDTFTSTVTQKKIKKNILSLRRKNISSPSEKR